MTVNVEHFLWFNRRSSISVTWYMWETLKNQKIMEQKFQDVDQELHYDNNLDTFAAYSDQHFNQELISQQCR